MKALSLEAEVEIGRLKRRLQIVRSPSPSFHPAVPCEQFSEQRMEMTSRNKNPHQTQPSAPADSPALLHFPSNLSLQITFPVICNLVRIG